MKTFTRLEPLSKELILKISILKTMMYCGVLWGLYHQQGWAITLDTEDFIFPFWLSSLHAHQYAQNHWHNYTPKKITPEEFENALLPTLTRLKVTPVLFNASTRQFKLSSKYMHHFFFRQHTNRHFMASTV